MFERDIRGEPWGRGPSCPHTSGGCPSRDNRAFCDMAGCRLDPSEAPTPTQSMWRRHVASLPPEDRPARETGSRGQDIAPPPLFTVLIPTRDRPDLIGRALRSVLDQDSARWECIVVLNDRDRRPIEAYQEALAPFLRDPRFILIDRSESGIGESLAAGLALSRGFYVAVLDDDDHWEPGFLGSLGAALERDPAAVFAYCDLRHAGSRDGPPYPLLPPGPSDDPWRTLRDRNWIPFPVAMARRSALIQAGGFASWAGGCCDWGTWLALTMVHPRFVHVPEALTIKHWHRGNTSRDAYAMTGCQEVQRRVAAGYFGPARTDRESKGPAESAEIPGNGWRPPDAVLYAAALDCPHAEPVSGCTNRCRRDDPRGVEVSIIGTCYDCRAAALASEGSGSTGSAVTRTARPTSAASPAVSGRSG